MLCHENTKEWYRLYLQEKDDDSEKVLPELTLDFLKYFLTSKTAFDDLEHDSLLKCFKSELKLKNYRTFRYKLIPAIREELDFAIEKILQDSYSVVLIPDGWTGRFSNTEYLGLGPRDFE